MPAAVRAHSRDPHHAASPSSRGRPDIAPPAPLPAPIASLVGRAEDIEAVVATLRREEVRLVTLTGPGGVGKSRLALAAGAALQPHVADGVRLVRLAAVRDANLVLATMASILGLSYPTGRPPLDILEVALHDRQILFILDNFEQVVSAGADLADLLRACPGLKALVTSRSRLRVRGEHVFPVLPLAFPEYNVSSPLEALARYPALELFVQRAREVRPELTIAGADLRAIAGICQRLDGLPLAIELAAARADILPPPVLLERLRQRLPLLTGGARDLPDRLRTMRDAIAWSYDLLGDDERRIFRQLAVFPAGFTAAAAAAVGGMDNELATIDALGSLADKSLLRRLPDAGPAEPRYGMLQTIREFALEALRASSEEHDVSDRHAAYFLSYAEEVDPLRHDTGEEIWRDQLDAEYDSLRAALGWYQETAQSEKLLRLAGALSFYWYYRGHLREGRGWLSTALQAAPGQTAPGPRAWALMGSGLLANVSGDAEQASSFLTESLALWHETNDEFGRALAGSLLSGVLVRQGDYDRAATLLERNLRYFRDVNRSWTAHALFHLGIIAFARRDFGQAAPLLEEAIAVSLSYGARGDTLNPQRFLGLIACAAEDRRQAAARFGEVLALLRERGSPASIAIGLADVATFAALGKAWDLSARLFAKGGAILQAETVSFSPPALDDYLRAQEQARAALGTAAYEAAARAGRSLSLEDALSAAEAILDPARGLAAQSSADATLPPDNPLTEREQDVLRLLATGKSNPEIAEALYIGRGTVRTHVSNILGKLGAKTRTEAAALARKRGMI